MATRRRNNKRRLYEAGHAHDLGAVVSKNSPNGAFVEYERILSSARQDVRELLQSEDMRPQREAVLNLGSVVEVQALMKVAEQRLALIAKRMQDDKRQAEMAVGRAATKFEEFCIKALVMWPRINIKVTKEFYQAENILVVTCKATVRGEKEPCLVHTEPFSVFPSMELQAKLGLVG